jgi:hypothetical protein
VVFLRSSREEGFVSFSIYWLDVTVRRVCRELQEDMEELDGSKLLLR